MRALDLICASRRLVLSLILLLFVPIKVLSFEQSSKQHSLVGSKSPEGIALYRWGINYQNISIAALLGECSDFSVYHKQAIEEIVNIKSLNFSVMSEVDFYTFSSTFLKFMLQKCNAIDRDLLPVDFALIENISNIISIHDVYIESVHLPKMLYVSDVLLLKMEVEMLVRALIKMGFVRDGAVMNRKNSLVFERFVARLRSVSAGGQDDISFGNNRSNFTEKRFRCVESSVRIPKCPAGYKKFNRPLEGQLSSVDIFGHETVSCPVPFNAFDISHGRRLVPFLIVLNKTNTDSKCASCEINIFAGKLLLDMVEEAFSNQAGPIGLSNYMNGDNGWYKLRVYEYSNSYCYSGYGPSELTVKADGFGYYFLSAYSQKIRDYGKNFQRRYQLNEKRTSSNKKFYELQVKPQLRVLEAVFKKPDDYQK